MIEIKHKHAGYPPVKFYQWKCSRCSLVGSWDSDVQKILNDGIEHVKQGCLEHLTNS